MRWAVATRHRSAGACARSRISASTGTSGLWSWAVNDFALVRRELCHLRRADAACARDAPLAGHDERVALTLRRVPCAAGRQRRRRDVVTRGDRPLGDGGAEVIGADCDPAGTVRAHGPGGRERTRAAVPPAWSRRSRETA